ncbi:hypothetical protein CRENBAI_011077 [Crenichthys baileyi]|uniref:Uncharacterized protein n=1 Tax=Crenichthys baileyi TaxID=28760 RepID=A0AAV9SQJ8_9TELE
METDVTLNRMYSDGLTASPFRKHTNASVSQLSPARLQSWKPRRSSSVGPLIPSCPGDGSLNQPQGEVTRNQLQQIPGNL